MNTKKATKRALLTSVMALVMCVVMLVGTTFAWFTDTASTGVNKIQAGNLDIELQMKDSNGSWVSAEGETLQFKTADNRTDNILWEPGCRYELPELRVVNKGNLALKYKVIINGIKGDAKLNEAIDWTIAYGDEDAKLTGDVNGFEYKMLPKAAGDTDYPSQTLTIKGTMKTTAGNEYQGLSIDGIGVTVVAAQYTYEKDSIDDQYDANADATIQVNKDNIQDYLDGKYGSIDGMTLVLAEGDYGQLELGRATKYAGSHTRYFICENQNTKTLTEYTFDEYYALKNNGSFSYVPMYIRSMNDVTFKAADGAQVTVAGVYASSGHKHDNAYDYVLDREVVSGNNTYFVADRLTNITFDGITFTAKSDINTSIEQSVIDGFTFRNCVFNINNTASGNQAIHYYNENNNGHVSNLVVKDCVFNNCYQGVYTNHIYGVTVDNCKFDTTEHNAIAVQDFAGAGNHGAVVITNNAFANIGDRIIRFNNVGADTQITIKGNVATSSGDDAGEVIKATSLASGIKYDISGNSWGVGTTVVNPELVDK